MNNSKITIRELLTWEIDADVYNDVTDDWEFAFVGPIELSEAGKKHFAEVLELEVIVKERAGYPTTVTVLLDGVNWERKYSVAEAFFKAVAGYCSESNYELWFIE